MAGQKQAGTPEQASASIERTPGFTQKLWLKRWLAQLREFVPMGTIRHFKLDNEDTLLTPQLLQRLMNQLTPSVRAKVAASLEKLDVQGEELDDFYTQEHVSNALQVRGGAASALMGIRQKWVQLDSLFCSQLNHSDRQRCPCFC